ncbi:MAG: matrixin family metalloprotease [Blastocatellales bacterium]
MKYLARFILLIVIFSIAGHKTESYVRSPLSSGNGTPLSWNLANPMTAEVVGGRIVYNLHQAGSDNLSFSQVEQAIAASFQAWEDVPTSAIAFSRGPNTTSTKTGNDNLLQLFWLENSTTTSDGLNVAGVLALSRLTSFASGPRTGEIIDASLTFNGNQFQWAVDGRNDAADVVEIATHEIGHILGLSHTPIGGATMFPRTGVGRLRGRTLESDDAVAVSAVYPAAGFESSTGTIRGRVADNNGAAIFGAHVAVVDANGNTITGALSQTDGSYSIQGLPPGNYTVYAEPLDSVSGAFFSRGDLQSFFSGAALDFHTTGDFQVNVGGGSTTTLDIAVTRGAPLLDAWIVYDVPNSAFLNVATVAAQGQNNLTIGVAGPGLPQSGAPLSVSGAGITILRTYFRTTNNGLPAVMADINVSHGAPTGMRNIIVNNGSQRTIMTGAIELIAGSGTPPVATVNAARFTNSVAAESIVSAFGGSLAVAPVSAASNPLPASLGGTQVRLRDSSGNERLAPLFFVSPNQINYQIAPGIVTGPTSVTITSGDGSVSTGSILVESVAPGVFAMNANGRGVAAALALRFRNGVQSYESIYSFDSSQNQFVPVPIDLGPATDQVFLVLFCTGVRFRSSLSAVSYDVGGATGTPLFAGPQGGLTGLDQVNIPLSRNLIGRGPVNVTLTVDGKTSNTVKVNIK